MSLASERGLTLSKEEDDVGVPESEMEGSGYLSPPGNRKSRHLRLGEIGCVEYATVVFVTLFTKHDSVKQI